MKKLLGLLTLSLAFSSLAQAQSEPMPRPYTGAVLEGHPDAKNDRHPESFYGGGNHNMGTHSVMRCKDGTMHKARADACRGHDHEPK
ncbi:hypothetical protein SAMN04515620_11917 [Collimonas sp. OK607]|uniref:hypothetical protein n=1 Tax=Collimonas sp. OK607 TaxID=1798194 RepID=UPI0008E5571A|nr:hypothetical protein [Collimonas sp. OK607]SFB11922.1 hypothetical protein SAMN04515620_11917 [Collimonas sp. OK607]